MSTKKSRLVVVLSQGEVACILSDINLDINIISRVYDDVEREYFKDAVDGEFISLDTKKDYFVPGIKYKAITDKNIVDSYWSACEKAFK
jgi:hypothetical protein